MTCWLISVQVTVGPMARDMDGLILLTQALFTPRMHNLDPIVPPLSFRDEVSLSVDKLRNEYFFYARVVEGDIKQKCITDPTDRNGFFFF